MDTSCGTKLNTDRGILATHPDWHAGVVNTIFWSTCHVAHVQLIEAIVDSRVATSSALHAAADMYEDANCHDFVQKLRDAAFEASPSYQLSSKRGQELLSIFSKGSAAIRLALAQRAISGTEVESMLYLHPDAVSELIAKSFGSKDSYINPEFSDAEREYT